MKKKSLPLSQVYRLLEPGPVVLLTTVDANRPNIMTMSWHMMIDFDPPLVGCVVSNRDFTLDILRKTKECVINIPTVEIARQVTGCGNTSGRNIDKFRKFGLTPSAALKVRAPLIDECFASLECRVVNTGMVNKYNIFILEVVKAWINRSKKNPQTIHHRGQGNFMVAGRTIRLPSKMK